MSDPTDDTAPTIRVFPDPAAVARAAADLVVEHARRAHDVQDTFALCLAGGSTPKAAYELLASDDYRPKIEWNRVEVFFGDERRVPPDHADSNYRTAKLALLDHVPIPGDNVYRMKGELDPSDAAAEYDAMLADKFAGDAGVDLMLLGMGDDGHTLSLFPGTAALDEREAACVANRVDELDAWRITMTAPFADRSGHVAALITGANKAAVLAEALEGEGDPRRLPIRLVSPGPYRLTYLLDAAAAGMDAE